MWKLLLSGVLLSLLSLFVLPSQAAVTVNSIVTPQTPNRGVVQFLPASTPTAYLTLYTAGANGSKCFSMWATSNDSAAHVLTVQLVNATIKYGGMTLTTGTSLPGFATGVGALNLMSSTVWPGLPLDSDGNPYIILASGDTLQATYTTAVTAADAVNIVTTCSDF